MTEEEGPALLLHSTRQKNLVLPLIVFKGELNVQPTAVKMTLWQSRQCYNTDMKYNGVCVTLSCLMFPDKEKTN